MIATLMTCLNFQQCRQRRHINAGHLAVAAICVCESNNRMNNFLLTSRMLAATELVAGCPRVIEEFEA
jgi:hypothetical protein